MGLPCVKANFQRSALLLGQLLVSSKNSERRKIRMVSWEFDDWQSSAVPRNIDLSVELRYGILDKPPRRETCRKLQFVIK